jgi:cell division protein FtsB
MKNKVINWSIIVVGLLLIINLSRSIYDLSQKNRIVEEAEEQVKKAETENAKLREQYREVRKEEYIERIAREKLGLGKEGEVVVVLPNNDKIRNSKFAVPAGRQEIRKEREEKTEVPVWKQWVELFL